MEWILLALYCSPLSNLKVKFSISSTDILCHSVRPMISIAMCEKPCIGPIYVCDSGISSPCSKDIYFHSSCLEFPRQICHPFHPFHLLTLFDHENFQKCKACRKSYHGYNTIKFNYICQVTIAVFSCTLNAVPWWCLP